ncbi:hypothetical protein CPB86DRAFT_798109 [Serendipita vermifera]|nr:hypothetical protein CPB86DRAFT_798109 [Serendipita vermifera]
MSSQIPTRRPVRATRPVNDENAPSRIGVLGKAKTVVSENINAKNNAKEVTTLKASAKPRVVLGQQRDTTNLVAGKRKRDALGDATNETKSKATALKPSITISSTAKAPTHSRASSVSTNVSLPKDKENAARPRAPLGVKSKNIAPTVSAASGKEKLPSASSEATAVATKRVVRRPLSAKPAQAPATTTTTTNVTVSRTKVTETSVRAEAKRQVLQKSQVEKVSKTTKVAKIDLTDADEDNVRSHKRPRLSDEVEDAVELKNVTVEKVHEALTVAVTKPEDEEPEDLDKDDLDDPLMVAEYVVEIFEYLRALEKTTMPNPKYMQYQTALKPHMRGILGEWIIGIHRGLRMVPETLFIAMNLIDRFLSVRTISLEKVQLVGVVCLLIASKYEEICAPTISMMLKFSAKSSTVDEIKEAEKYVLKSIKYNLSYSSPITFLRRCSKADGFDPESRTLAKYLVELYCVEYRLIQYTPSCIAAAAMWLARLALDRGEWTANLAHYAGYKEAELLPCANVMLNYILKYPKHASLFEKYASRKFNKASVFMRSWALARWDEGWDVDLGECLEALKEDSKARILAGTAGVVELLECPVFHADDNEGA